MLGAKSKILSKYIDKGLGFAVELRDVPLISFRDDWVLDVSPDDIASAVYRHMHSFAGRFTGNHIRFIRHHNRMTMEEFADRFGVTQPAVQKWERKGDEPTGMAWGTEKDIRLMIAEQTTSSDRMFRRAYSSLTAVPDSEGGGAFVFRVNARKKLVMAK